MGNICEQSFSITLESGGQFSVMDADSVAVLDTGATANLVRLKWLGHHNEILGRWGVPRPENDPACTRCRCGDGRLGEARCAADISLGIAGNRTKFTAFAVEADIPALLRKGAMGALGGQLVVSRDISTLRKQGADNPTRLDNLGPDVLSAVSFG